MKLAVEGPVDTSGNIMGVWIGTRRMCFKHVQNDWIFHVRHFLLKNSILQCEGLMDSWLDRRRQRRKGKRILKPMERSPPCRLHPWVPHLWGPHLWALHPRVVQKKIRTRRTRRKGKKRPLDGRMTIGWLMMTYDLCFRLSCQLKAPPEAGPFASPFGAAAVASGASTNPFVGAGFGGAAKGPVNPFAPRAVTGYRFAGYH